MNKNILRNNLLLMFALCCIAFGIGFFAKPTKVKTEVKEVVKTVTVVQEAKTKIVYRTIVKTPDGTITETEHSQEETNINSSNSTEASKTASKEVTRDIGLTLSALAIVDSSSISGHRDYGLLVTKRVLDSVNIGVLATTDKKIGLSLGLSF